MASFRSIVRFVVRDLPTRGGSVLARSTHVTRTANFTSTRSADYSTPAGRSVGQLGRLSSGSTWNARRSTGADDSRGNGKNPASFPGFHPLPGDQPEISAQLTAHDLCVGV